MVKLHSTHTSSECQKATFQTHKLSPPYSHKLLAHVLLKHLSMGKDISLSQITQGQSSITHIGNNVYTMLGDHIAAGVLNIDFNATTLSNMSTPAADVFASNESWANLAATVVEKVPEAAC